MTFYLNKGNVFAIPVLHYRMELALETKRLFEKLKPDCVAVELPEVFQGDLLRAASRLPDISVLVVEPPEKNPLYYLCEPCDASCEGLRSAVDAGAAAFCIDLDVDNYPLHQEPFPDPYSIIHIGLQAYYEAYYEKIRNRPRHPLDVKRELYMARRLKELSLLYEKVLFIGGFYHTQAVLDLLDQQTFPTIENKIHWETKLCTLTEEACREGTAECAWITLAFEEWRTHFVLEGLLDRQRLIYYLYKNASEQYEKRTGNTFQGYHLRNTMKFARNYSLLHLQLMPDLHKIVAAAQGCVDHNYAYEVWSLATDYPYRTNIDNLPELPLTVEQLWGTSKKMRFHLKQKSSKGQQQLQKRKNLSKASFSPPSPFSICSFPPEDVIVERFGEKLKKKGNLLMSEDVAHSIPFTTSLEEGIDTRETIRHWAQKKLYVKSQIRPPGASGTVVVIFSEDFSEDLLEEKYPWKTTWIGEHYQESDMAFYATSMYRNVVGPGISRCEYGGFMMSSPPQRLLDIWHDPDYLNCRTKAEVLLQVAIDYALKPVIVYVASKPPRSKWKSYARKFGKKIIYLPIGGLSPPMLNKIRVFHVLDGHNKREIAGDYIF